MDKRKTLEHLKSAVIVILCLTLVFLVWKSGLFKSSAGAAGTSRVDTQNTESGEIDDSGSVSAEAARPMIIVLNSEDGNRHADKYDTASLNRTYERTGRLFAEAMGSAGEPVQIDAEDWHRALCSPGACFIYLSPVKLSVLDGWLGTEITGLWKEMSARSVCIYEEHDGVHFAFADPDTGLMYSCATTLPAEALAEQTANAGESGAAYLFETGRTDVPEQDVLIFNGSSEHPFLDASDPLASGETMKDVLRQFGVDMESGSSYTDSDGTRVFIDNDFTIRIKGTDTLIYRLNEEPDGNAVSAAIAVEMVRDIIQRTAGRYCGDAEIRFLSAGADADGTYSIEFCYTAAGGRIFTGSSGTAVRARVKAGVITDMTVRFRSYTVGAEQASLMPELQTAAAAGGRFVLGYSDTGAGVIGPEWFAD